MSSSWFKHVHHPLPLFGSAGFRGFVRVEAAAEVKGLKNEAKGVDAKEGTGLRRGERFWMVLEWIGLGISDPAKKDQRGEKTLGTGFFFFFKFLIHETLL